VATEASLEYFITHAGQLLKGDLADDLVRLTDVLEELKVLKDAKVDFLGRNGHEAQVSAFARARSVGEGAVGTAQHLRASLGCVVCEE
jgi:hypothetical protein